MRGYNFNRIESPFKDYVKDLYEIKSNSKGAVKAIAKSLLNNLIGRLGLSLIKPITELVSTDTLNTLLRPGEQYFPVKSYEPITDKDSLISYLPVVDEQICLEHGLDYNKVIADSNKNFPKSLGQNKTNIFGCIYTYCSNDY